MTVAFFGMAIICLLLVVVIVLLLVGVDRMLERERQQRSELQDRLMAINQPVALTTTKAYRDPEPSVVTYVDESREWDLSPAGGGNGTQ